MLLNNVKCVDKLFNGSLNSKAIYTTIALKKTLKKFEYVASSEDSSLIFITGEIGSGKSTLLQLLKYQTENTHATFLLQRPFTDMQCYKEYLCNIANTPYISNDDETILLETLATTIQSPIVLFIDAFELMSYQQIQLTLKLANLPMISVVCAIRSSEAEKLFNDIRLNIKNKIYFTCNPLTTDEIAQYISFLLNYMNETSHTKLFPKKVFSDLYRYTCGNWRRINAFLHVLFKFLAQQRAMGETIEQVSSIMLAKIALEQKIITINSFKRKYFWDSLGLTFILTEAFGVIISIGVFVLFTFHFERFELNANSYHSSPLPTSILQHIENPSSIEQIIANPQNIQAKQENSYESLLFLKIKSPIHTKEKK